jgi:hypothetical protein
MWISKKQLQELLKQEYLHGAAATAEAFKLNEQHLKDKQEQDALEFESQKRLILEDWETLKRAKNELAATKAEIVLDGLRSIFGNLNRETV